MYLFRLLSRGNAILPLPHWKDGIPLISFVSYPCFSNLCTKLRQDWHKRLYHTLRSAELSKFLSSSSDQNLSTYPQRQCSQNIRVPLVMWHLSHRLLVFPFISGTAHSKRSGMRYTGSDHHAGIGDHLDIFVWILLPLLKSSLRISIRSDADCI